MEPPTTMLAASGASTMVRTMALMDWLTVKLNSALRTVARAPTTPSSVTPVPSTGPERIGSSAIASLVCGILGVVSCGYTFFVGPILAIVFAVVAKKQIPVRNQAGGGMATAGLVLGIIGVVIGLGLIALFVGLFASGSSTTIPAGG